MPHKFDLGLIVATPNALRSIHPEDILLSLLRHEAGDWGDLCDEDKQINEYALRQGGRLFSSYTDHDHVKFWIITEADCSVTTVLLPDDY